MTTKPERHRFDVVTFDRMVEAGILGRDDRVELIEGEIVDMTPIGHRHTIVLTRLTKWASQHLADRAIPWAGSITLDGETKPQPDLALVQPPDLRYANGDPGAADVFLVVEVADSSIFHDRLTKARLYAEAGIPEYWIVHLGAEAGRVIVHRQPGPDGYQLVSTSRRGDAVAPEAFPDATLRVEDVLPEWPPEPAVS